MSDVVGSGWTQVTFLRTVGVGSPGLASLTPLSGGGSGPSRVLFFVTLSPLVVLFCRSLDRHRVTMLWIELAFL